MGDFPNNGASPSFDLFDKAATVQGNGRDDRTRSGKESPHPTDKAVRQALHLADFIDKIDLSRSRPRRSPAPSIASTSTPYFPTR